MRKLRGNRERMRKWREIHSQDFLILCLFPPSLSISYIKIVTFCRKMLNTALLSRMSQKHTHYEKVILGQTGCENALQVVTACLKVSQYTPFILKVLLINPSIHPFSVLSVKLMCHSCCRCFISKRSGSGKASINDSKSCS